jgi:Protein tyrosine phosphatase-like protein, PTPLA
MTPKDGYLVLYNLACCLGWFGVLVVSFLSLTKNVSSLGIIQALASIYNDDNDTFIPMSLLLAITQIAAVMEIIHAAIGFVRSPVMITGMQVSSRLVALFAIYYSTSAQGKLIFGSAFNFEWITMRRNELFLYIISIYGSTILFLMFYFVHPEFIHIHLLRKKNWILD